FRRRRSHRYLPPRRILRRPDLEGRQSWRSSPAGADQVRTGDQSEDCQHTGTHCAADAARTGRRGDRISEGASHEGQDGPTSLPWSSMRVPDSLNGLRASKRRGAAAATDAPPQAPPEAPVAKTRRRLFTKYVALFVAVVCIAL